MALYTYIGIYIYYKQRQDTNTHTYIIYESYGNIVLYIHMEAMETS